MNPTIPVEADTIAVKRAKRLAQKILEKRLKAFRPIAWWNTALLDLGVVIFLVSLNLLITLPLFQLQVPATPFVGPVIPLLSRIVDIALGSTADLSQAVQLVNLAFFLFFPITFYTLVKFISGRKLAALIAGVVATLPFYPFALLRITAGFFGRDGAHIASTAFIPLAVYWLISFLRHGKITNLILAAFMSTFIALTSPFGFIIYAIFSVIAVFSEMLLGSGRLKLLRFLFVLVISAGLSAFWFNPFYMFWLVFGPVGSELRQMLQRLIPVSFFLVPVLGVFGYLLFDRKPALQPVFLACFWTIAFAIIVFAGGSSNLYTLNFSRFEPELGLALAYLVGVAIVRAVDYCLTTRIERAPWLQNTSVIYGVASGFVLLLIIAISLRLNAVELSTAEVLGLWDEIERGKIWQAKDYFQGPLAWSGYGITSITLGGLIVVGRKAREVR